MLGIPEIKVRIKRKEKELNIALMFTDKEHILNSTEQIKNLRHSF